MNGLPVDQQTSMPDGGHGFDGAETTVANRATAEFLANMSHELRTPLNAIIGFSEIMQTEALGPFGNERYKEYVEAIHRSGCHLLVIINGILDLSKFEAGKYELLETDIDINNLFSNTIELVKPQAQSAGIDMSIKVPANFPALRGDENKIRQMLVNLVANAVKFTPATGAIMLGASIAANGTMLLRVADTGIGIAETDIEKAMAPFGQVDSGLDRKYEGTGLGLPLAQSFAEIHGAKLTLESAVGIGTEITVTFPVDRVSRIHHINVTAAE